MLPVRVSNPGVEPRTPDLRVKYPTDCATWPGAEVVTFNFRRISYNLKVQSKKKGIEQELVQSKPTSHPQNLEKVVVVFLLYVHDKQLWSCRKPVNLKSTHTIIDKSS